MEPLLQEPKVWIAVSFVLFFAMIWKVDVFGKIARALDERGRKIKDELEEATRLREEAQATLAAYQAKQALVMQEAEQMLAATRADADAMAKAARDELKAGLEKRTRLAMDRIAQAEAKAVQDVQAHMVDIAMAASRAIVKEYSSQGGSEELIRLAVSDVERKIH